MLTTLFDALCSALGDGLNVLISAFLSFLEMDLSTYLEVFPFFDTAYKICRGIAWGMLILISSLGLGTFIFGSVEGKASSQTAGETLVRTFFSAGLILWGGHIVEMVVKLATIPFNVILNMDVIDPGFGDNFASELAMGVIQALMGTPEAAFDLTAVLIQFLVVTVITWNLLKLMLEVCERYLIVGVLAFTAPLVYPTMASVQTEGILKKWTGMFLGSCLGMSISVLMIKLIISGFGVLNRGEHVLLKLLLILAMCKIAQQSDRIMQQLGLGVPTTGGGVIRDLFGAARIAGRAVRGVLSLSNTGSSGKTVLGENTDSFRNTEQRRSDIESTGNVRNNRPLDSAAVEQNRIKQETKGIWTEPKTEAERHVTKSETMSLKRQESEGISVIGKANEEIQGTSAPIIRNTSEIPAEISMKDPAAPTERSQSNPKERPEELIPVRDETAGIKIAERIIPEDNSPNERIRDPYIRDTSQSSDREPIMYEPEIFHAEDIRMKFPTVVDEDSKITGIKERVLQNQVGETGDAVSGGKEILFLQNMREQGMMQVRILDDDAYRNIRRIQEGTESIYQEIRDRDGKRFYLRKTPLRQQLNSKDKKKGETK